MTLQGGVAAYRNSWKRDCFTISDSKIDLQIDHDFWSQTVVTQNTGWIVGNVRVKNTGNIFLKDVKIYIDIDDDSSGFDAHLCDANGNIIDTGLEAPCLSFGDLAPGVSSTQKSYWWIVKARFPDFEGSDYKTTNFNLYPTFTADFKQQGQAFQSQSNLENA